MSKAKGSRAEHKTIKRLETVGYTCTRAAGSMGAWDIIAISPSDVRLIQVKCNRNPGSVEMETLELFQCPQYVSKEVWVWKDFAREPIITHVKTVRQTTAKDWSDREENPKYKIDTNA